jgi:hypothetical protein
MVKRPQATNRLEPVAVKQTSQSLSSNFHSLTLCQRAGEALIKIFLRAARSQEGKGIRRCFIVELVYGTTDLRQDQETSTGVEDNVR